MTQTKRWSARSSAGNHTRPRHLVAAIASGSESATRAMAVAPPPPLRQPVPGLNGERKKPDMNDNTRDLKASEIASHAVQAAGQAAYDSPYQRTYRETYEGLRELTLCLLACYDRQPHPVSMMGALLAAETIDEIDPQHKSPPNIAGAARVTLTKLADKVIESCRPPGDPN